MIMTEADGKKILELLLKIINGKKNDINWLQVEKGSRDYHFLLVASGLGLVNKGNSFHDSETLKSFYLSEPGFKFLKNIGVI